MAYGADSAVYRIGLVGTQASGKTCLLTALGMARHPNPRGGGADLLALGQDATPSVRAGHQWIDAAKARLEQGKWPIMNPNDEQDRSIRYRFTDARARVKSVEVFDYSGELLRPETSEAEIATRLRAVLRQMDGLIVLAEHPVPDRDNGKLEQELNDMMRVVALLDSEAVRRAGHAALPVPIALVINKWDRSAFFQEDAPWEAQREMLERLFLQAAPAPIHAAMRDKLRAVAQERFEIFPVSACGPVGVATLERGLENADLPPKGGRLRSFGLEDPFLWLIEQCDDLHLTEEEQRLATLSKNPGLPPWTAWGLFRRLGAWGCARIGRRTPEYPRLASLRVRAGGLLARQMVVYMVLLLMLEAGLDCWSHRRAETRLSDRGAGGSWRDGCQWLRNYGLSSPGRHFFYSTLFFHKQAALDRLHAFEGKQDEEEMAAIRAVCDRADTDQIDTGTAQRLLNEHTSDFPRSPHAEECEQKLRTIGTVVSTRRLREHLAGWRRDLDPLRKTERDSGNDVELKLRKVSSLLNEVTRAQDLPAEGELRNEWNTLLGDLDQTRKELAVSLDVRTLHEKIHQAIAGEDYLTASTFLSSADFQRSPDPALLDAFLQSLPAGLQRKCVTLARGGESWEQAEIYAGQFLAEGRAEILPATVREAVERAQVQARQEGDTYLYEVARQNRDNKSLNAYLTAAPLRAMSSEAANYLQWLQDREAKKSLVFKLVKIKWQNAESYWFGKTVVEFYVNTSPDDRNDARESATDSHGEIDDPDGFRRVTVKVPQIEAVDLTLKVWHVPNLSGWDKLLEYHKNITGEGLVAQKVLVDAPTGAELTFEVTGVIPEPSLPTWHSVQ